MKLRIGAALVTVGILGGMILGPRALSSLQGPPPQVCQEPDRAVTLYGVKLSERRYGYGLTPNTASIPGPTLEMVEGECLAVTFVNESDRRMSIHAHGVDYTVASDGTPLNSSCVRPGRSRTYVFRAHGSGQRDDGSVRAGSAGYWHYHDHCMGGDHGTAGIRRGIFGAFIVRKPGDTPPDRDPFVVVMGPGSRINMKKAPDTPVFQAREGERVEFAVIGHGDAFHTFHLHGHRWADNRTGVPRDVDDPVSIIDTKTLGPADSFGFQLVAGEGVGPGAWMYHCHVQGHSDAGMAGIFMVEPLDGGSTRATRRALMKWNRHGRHD